MLDRFELRRLKKLSKQQLVDELAKAKGIKSEGPAEEAELVVKPKLKKRRKAKPKAKVLKALSVLGRTPVTESPELGIVTRGGKVSVRGRPGQPITIRRQG